MTDIAPRGLPAERTFSDEFLRLWPLVQEWIKPYYDGEHMRRAADWLLFLAPDAPEHLVIAAATHDLERSVPGGPALDKANMAWDDRAYNDAHASRSAVVVSEWLTANGASAELAASVQQPICEHEFGGSAEGDLMQAADSISFLEVNGGLVSDWVLKGECTQAKSREKLDWMRERVRLERARPFAHHFHAESVAALVRATS